MLVTGGAGFIGSHLVDALLARGERVVVFDNFDPFYDPAIKRANLAAHATNPAFTLIEGDILDPDALVAAFTAHAPTAVVHLAARAGVRPSIADPGAYEATNVRGTYVLLEAMRHAGVRRLVFASSSSVYGEQPTTPFREDALPAPLSPYAATKLAGEACCGAYARLHGIRAVALRLFTVYGPRQRPDLAITKFAKLIAAGAPIPMYGDGGSERDYTYVGDVVAGILAALAYTATPFEVVNLGGGQAVSLSTMIAQLAASLGRPARLDRQPEQPGDAPRTAADLTKAGALLGYAPVASFETGLAATIAALGLVSSPSDDEGTALRGLR